MSQTSKRLERLVRDEWQIFALIVLVSAPSSVVFAFEQLGQGQHDFIETWLRASWSKPWGLVTAIFVHANFDHYIANMTGLLIFLPFLVAANWSLEHALGRRRVSVSAWVPFASAVLANLLVFVIQPGSSPFGASGVVYAIIGVTVGLSLANLLHYAMILIQRAKADRETRVLSFENAVVFGTLFILVLSSPAGFAGVGTGVNAAGHILAFLAGLFASAAYGFRVVVL
jgi:membrane associated rhomboid family serine protease